MTCGLAADSMAFTIHINLVEAMPRPSPFWRGILQVPSYALPLWMFPFDDVIMYPLLNGLPLIRRCPVLFRYKFVAGHVWLEENRAQRFPLLWKKWQFFISTQKRAHSIWLSLNTSKIAAGYCSKLDPWTKRVSVIWVDLTHLTEICKRNSMQLILLHDMTVLYLSVEVKWLKPVLHKLYVHYVTIRKE